MKKRKNDTSQRDESPSRLIDARIKELGDWRGETLSRIRSLIKQADPGVTEEWKWRSGVVSRRVDLHGRDIQERGQVDILQGCSAEGSFEALQLQP